MKVFVVTKIIAGFAREDPPEAMVSGVYSKRKPAELHRMLIGGKIAELEVDDMPPGIMKLAREFGKD